MTSLDPIQAKPGEIVYNRSPAKTDLSVLVLSSQAGQRITIASYLRGLGHRLHVAKSAREAIELDCANMVDLLIVDCPPGDMPLHELLTSIREQRRLMRDIVDSNIVPAVVISNQPGMTNGMGQLGVVASLRKPLNLKAMELCVQKVLSGELSVDRDRLVNLCVMDPEARALAYFSRLLKADDVAIHELRDIFDLNDKIASCKIDLLIVEVMGLPDDPVEAMRDIIARCPSCQVIVCTALHDSAMHDVLRGLGVSQVITKPVNPFNLRAMVREYVSRIQQEN